ncbi:MAG: glucose-6-phosphate isomerase [Bacteroidota bacterium]
MLPKVNPVQSTSWSHLQAAHEELQASSLKELFELDGDRFEKYSIAFEDFLFDFSKHFLNDKVLRGFDQLLREVDLSAAKKAMKSGQRINETEDRAVLHTALRNLNGGPIEVDGQDVMPEVKGVLSQMKSFTEKLHDGSWKGYSGQAINAVVNIGIGGSDLGPFMVTKALKPYQKAGIQSHFVSNVDASDLLEKLEGLNPETTLFIIASKTFTTQETMTNANSARDWFLKTAVDKEHIKKHFVAVSTNSTKVQEFGIATENMFEFWDWVGGRYSLWSAIGLSIACAVGYEHFEALLEGAEAMDKHFFETDDLSANIPTMMAILGIWYNNFFGAETQAILPYDHLLSHLSRYLQQGDMESNGKGVDRAGHSLKYQSGQIIWGEPGTNGQHAFYQLIHQGTKMIPCDFIAAANPPHGLIDHQEKLLANFIAQTEALMIGKSETTVKEELRAAGKGDDELKKIAPFKVFEGNRPTTSILMKRLTPRALGSLIAAYEHKIFVQGVIWNVFSFDQWGVELGKQLAGNILKDLKGVPGVHDASTLGLIQKYKDFKDA